MFSLHSSKHVKNVLFMQGRGGEELSTELSGALQICLLGGKSGAGAYNPTDFFFLNFSGKLKVY